MKTFSYHIHLIEHEGDLYSYRIISQYDSAPVTWYSAPACIHIAMREANDYIEGLRKTFLAENEDAAAQEPFATKDMYCTQSSQEWVQVSRPLWERLMRFICNDER